MARRWARWIGLGLLLVVLLAFGTWRLLREIPGLLAKAEDTIRREAEALGFRGSFRPVRFLGTRVSVEVRRSAGRFALPGAGSGNVPFDAAEADFFWKEDSIRVRKLNASGPHAKLSLSGQWDGVRRAMDLKFSGETDIAGWTASGAYGGDWLRLVATAGGVSFFAHVEGPLESPEGSGKILARNLLVPGNTPAEAEVSLAVSGKKIRMESFRGNLWDGALSGAGIYDVRTGKGDAKLSLEQAVFGKAPWDSLGVCWRPA